MKTSKLILGLVFLFSTIGCQKELQFNEDGNLVPKTVEQDGSLPSVAINGTLLHAETFGNQSDPMIVVLHGGPGGDYRYLLNCQQFADSGYYVVFYDQRGSGLSKREPRDSYTINVMFEDLKKVIEHYRVSSNQKVYLLGQSWGAILATGYVNQYPQDVTGMILCEPGGFVWQDIMDYVGRIQEYSISSETLNNAVYLDQFITGGENDHAILDYKLGLLAASDGENDSPVGDEGIPPFWRQGAVVNNALFHLGEDQKPDWTTNLQNYTTEILFAYSERNRAYGLDHAIHVSSAYPHVILERINGAGHDMITFNTGWNNFFPKAIQYLRSH